MVLLKYRVNLIKFKTEVNVQKQKSKDQAIKTLSSAKKPVENQYQYSSSSCKKTAGLI